MLVVFHLGVKSRDVADTVAEVLRGDGYEVAIETQSDDRLVMVNASPGSVLSADEITAARSRMDLLCRNHGGEFLGHSGLQQIVLPPDPLG